MAIPTYEQLRLPLLKLLKNQTHAISMREIRQQLAKQFHLTEQDLAEKMPSGKISKFAGRVGWAKTHLHQAGLIDQPTRGFCILSAEGQKLDLDKMDRIDNKFLMQFPSFVEFKKGNLENEQGTSDLNLSYSTKNVEQEQTPEEIIENTIQDLNANIKQELLQLIKQNSPQFFEQLVVDLLVAMGYGGSHQDAAKAIGKTSDGGIDGIISEDRLGLDKIYIQAKRWDNTTVGRPEIQKFKGALSEQEGAKKGVFITTSSFTTDAIQSAKKSGVVLIDGDRLASLMIEFGLGVQIERSFHIYKIDNDRFDEDL